MYQESEKQLKQSAGGSVRGRISRHVVMDTVIGQGTQIRVAWQLDSSGAR